MDYKTINCDSVVKKITKKDSLFHGNYCVDPYQNCEFGCHYCDSSFEKTIYVKANVVDILKKELEHIKNGRIIIGSVHDPYQNTEKKFKLTRTILETLKQFNFPCHILTKSPLILRDIDILSQLECMITVSISSLDDQVVRIFEPEVPSPNDRLQTVQALRTQGITAGVALIPILPYIVESEVESIVKAARSVDAQYLLHKHLELKGDQERLFRNLIKAHYPHLLPKYDALYDNDFNPRKEYIQELNNTLSGYCKKFKISDKITI
ncbi:MAG: radical SAM protein [Thermoplasmata archaeon]|nr:radical SAM protein [Thermoplasmata archaeon]MBE3139622.1 radical SAM protein [Thermoplasmata archaeon]